MRSARERVATVILGGGRGSRLYPLTRDRAKPAVPLAGKYRLIDIALSNSINSGYPDVAVLTQFNSRSLNHHIALTYRFDMFGGGNVEIFAAQQTELGNEWFLGTADAVRKFLRQRGRLDDVEHVLVLSGDHLYRMDYRELVERHVAARADVTVSVLPLPRSEVEGFGVLAADAEGRIRRFREKPPAGADFSDLAPPSGLRSDWGLGPDELLASMGVYVFRIDALREALEDPTAMDFGKDVIPRSLETRRVFAHLFRGYWRDIGTIASFFEANLALTDEDPPFRFFQKGAPIYTRERFLPASKVWDASIRRSVVSDGCLLFGAEIERSVVGLRSRVQRGARLRDVILMGNDFYEEDGERAANLAKGIQAAGIGPECVLERAIVDKNARIGPRCVLRGDPSRPDQDGDGWFVRDGVVIVPKNARLPEGTVV